MGPSRYAGVVCVLTLCVAALAVGIAPASAQSAPTPINSCRTIADDGRYVLTENIENDDRQVCIQILSSDVVFDGGGHTIEGESANESVGVKVNNSLTTLSNVTVRNVSTTGWTAGAYYLDANDGTIQNVNASANERHGILLRASSNTRLENVTAMDNGRWSLYSVGNATNTTARGFETGTSNISFRASDVALTAIRSPPGDPPNRTTVGGHVGISSAGPNASLRLGMNYTDGSVAGANVTESTLRMWAYDGTWSQPSGVNFVNIRQNRVVAGVPKFSNASVFAPAGVTETPTQSTSTSAPSGEGTNATGGQTANATSSDDGPGLGVVAALVALFASAFLALRRR